VEERTSLSGRPGSLSALRCAQFRMGWGLPPSSATSRGLGLWCQSRLPSYACGWHWWRPTNPGGERPHCACSWVAVGLCADCSKPVCLRHANFSPAGVRCAVCTKSSAARSGSHGGSTARLEVPRAHQATFRPHPSVKRRQPADNDGNRNRASSWANRHCRRSEPPPAPPSQGGVLLSGHRQREGPKGAERAPNVPVLRDPRRNS
jgi:hypothetical protein